MSSYRSQDTRSSVHDSYGLPRYDHRDRDPYPDRRSRSHSRDRRYSSPPAHRRRSPSHDSSRTPDAPRGPAADMRRGVNTSRGWERLDRDRDTPYRRSSPSPYRRRGSGYRDQDEDGYRSPRYDGRSRSRSRSWSPRRRDRDRGRDRSRELSPHFGGPPSKEVILEGLPVHMGEDDISNELKYLNVEGLEDVRVIRDRQTKISRQFGFLRFSTLEYSRSFVEQNHPFIHLYSSSGNDQASKVRIAYSRERDDRPKNESDWTCKICNTSNYSTRARCFRCQAVRSDSVALTQSKPHHANNGESDVSPDNSPSQFIIIRGLEPTVTEELLAKGVSKLHKSAGGTQALPAAKKGFKVASTTGDTNLGAKEGSIRRVLLVRDRRTNESWRYGFAEFATVDDAQAALVRYNSFEKFTISSKPVLASYIHAGVFVPVLNPMPSTDRFTFSPLSNSAMKLAYWDEDAYVTELTVSAGDLEYTNGNGNSNSRSRGEITSSAAIVDAEGLLKPGKEGEKSKKRKADPSTLPAVMKVCKFWTDRHAELLQGTEPTTTSTSAPPNPYSSKASSAQKPNPKASPPDPPTQSFADLTRNCCLLCTRQFKTTAEVHKHERLSQLHRTNIADPTLVAKARAKLSKLGIVPPPPQAQGDTGSGPEYRDRARERRQQHKLPLKSPSTSTSVEDKERGAKAKLGPPGAEATPIAMAKGAALLSKMGYDPSSAAGKGLGRDGSGIAEPIQTDVYAPGVGLGAEGGRRGDAIAEAEGNTRDGESGYKGFVERVREGARGRYDRMQ